MPNSPSGGGISRWPTRIENRTGDIPSKRVSRFLSEHRVAIDAFKSTREAAFNAEREEWARSGELTRAEPLGEPAATRNPIEVPQGSELIEAPLGGSVWKIHVRPGEHIEKGGVIAAIEAMKTECTVPSPYAGIVRAIYVEERQSITPGMPIIALERPS